MRQVIDVAKGLEGLKRSTGIHAAAVVISKEPLTEYLPLQRKPEAGKPIEESQVTTQFEMHGVESLGLLKMDFLGLRNLPTLMLMRFRSTMQRLSNFCRAATPSVYSNLNLRRCSNCSERWLPPVLKMCRLL
ncbi:MAG: polymerase subunit alpha [Actinomycetota bacterium]